MPHPATCSGPARRRSTPPTPPPLRVGELYGRIGVESTATTDEIRKAYRRLARQLHPDLNPSDAGAAERFKGITEAYDVLSDPKQRAIYDLSGCQPRPH
ncbi:J domain-containing protein [Nonomuraea endophytica]|uniref:J domain-containing protein n=1 Tax=Nonomuraea endophytica TaxID=714136 RepID=UPI0037CC553D